MRKVKAMRGLGQYHGAGACAKMAIALDRRNIRVEEALLAPALTGLQAVNEFKVQVDECKLLDTLSKAKGLS